jgi:hypothetical protein
LIFQAMWVRRGIDRTNMQIKARPDKRQNARAG